MLTRLAPLVFVCLWATGFVGARLGMPYSEPGTFLTIRFVSAVLLLSAIALIWRAPWPGTRLALQAVGIGVLIHGVYLSAVFWAIKQGMPAGVSAVVVGLQPLLTALLAGWFLGELTTRRHWFGLVLGLVGVVLVLWPKLDVADAGVNGATITVTVIGMISVTVGTIFQKAVGAEMDLRSGTALQYFGAVLPPALLCLFETRQVDWTGEMIVAMVWAVVVLSFLAVFLLMWLISKGSVSQVSSLFFLVPAVATVMAYFLFDETLEPLQIIGMALCAGAVALASGFGNKRRA